VTAEAARRLDEELAPRPVYCPILHERRSLTVAEDACAGRFTAAGITAELGSEPDWLGGDFPADEEWRIECSKFAFGLDLAHAFALTGDVRFLFTWETLVRSWIEQVPADWDPTEVAARRIQHWLYAWQAFAAAQSFAGLRPGLEGPLLGSIGGQARYVRDHLTRERNHRTLELYALFVASLALPQLDPEGELLRFATAGLEENLRTDFRADGVHRESSTHYHLIALRSFVAARENARRFRLRFSAAFDERLERACDFALHCYRPDGGVPALSDADGRGYPELLELASALLGRPDLAYVASAGARGTPPARRNVSFPAAGYFVQRSGWGEQRPYREERFGIFDCGPLGDGGHGHYDLLSVELAACGRPLLVDPGRYTYAEGRPNLRRWFKGTAAHNTVCVDALDQTPYRRGKPSGPVAEGRFLGRLGAPQLDLLHGEAASPAYDAIHRRRVVFVAGEYWLIEDRLRGEQPHDYDLRFHLPPSAPVSAVVREGERVTFRARGLVLIVCAAAWGSVEPGWVAREYGRKLPAPVVSVVARGRTEATFLTLVAPVAEGCEAPSLHTWLEGAATVVQIDRVGPDGSARDLVVWSPARADLRLGPVRCGGAAAWLRESAAGGPLAVQACDVAWAEASGRRVETAPWIAWDAPTGLTAGTEAEL
jgi:hypothetical protein